MTGAPPTMTPLATAQALYSYNGRQALASLQSKIKTGGRKMTKEQLSYAMDVRDHLKELLDVERELFGRL